MEHFWRSGAGIRTDSLIFFYCKISILLIFSDSHNYLYIFTEKRRNYTENSCKFTLTFSKKYGIILLENKREVMNMKKIMNLLTNVICAFLWLLWLWLIASWLEISAHNTDPNYVYNQYNFFVWIDSLLNYFF